MKSQNCIVLRFSQLLALVVFICGSGCSSNQSFTSSSSNNGEGYGGKPTRYAHYDVLNPCAAVDSHGQALPNELVFVIASQASLVRSTCQDVTPQVLSASDYTITGSSLAYQGKSFDYQVITEFDVRKAGCPSSLNPMPGATRLNLFSDSLNLMSSNWFKHPGVETSLNGSLMGYPQFLVGRSQPAFTDRWRRVSQFPTIQADSLYALSFFAQSGNANQVSVLMYQDTTFDIQISINLTDGSTVTDMQTGATNLSVQSFAMGTGRFVTLYFKPTAILNRPDIGIGPSSTAAGASVNLASVVLENTAHYCVP